MSAAFTAVASGYKLPIFTIIPRKNELNGVKTFEQITIEYKTKSTFDDEIIVCYLNRIIIPYKLRRGFDKVLLIINFAPCQVTQMIFAVIIPSNCY